MLSTQAASPAEATATVGIEDRTQAPSDQRLDQLHREYSITCDPRIAEFLVDHYKGIAHVLARRMSKKQSELADVQQVAMFSLFKALQRFDPAREIRFATFAWRTVEGEIKRYFRDHGSLVHVPRTIEERSQLVRRTIEEMTHAAGSSPRVADVAHHLALSQDQVVEAIEARQSRTPDALDEPDRDSDRSVCRSLTVDNAAFERSEELSDLIKMINRLPANQRDAVYLRFFEEHTQTEVARLMGISQMHVSRLLSKACATMRELANTD